MLGWFEKKGTLQKPYLFPRRQNGWIGRRYQLEVFHMLIPDPAGFHHKRSSGLHP